jgi:hypothetical protein
VVVDQAGNRVLSPVGERFRDYVVALEQRGVRDVGMQQYLAKTMTERDVLVAQVRQASGDAGRQQANQQFLQQNNQPNRGGVLNGGGNPNTPARGGTLAEQIRQDLAANGITDQAILSRDRGE